MAAAVLPLDRCRDLLASEASRPYTNEEIRLLRDFLYELARIECSIRERASARLSLAPKELPRLTSSRAP